MLCAAEMCSQRRTRKPAPSENRSRIKIGITHRSSHRQKANDEEASYISFNVHTSFEQVSKHRTLSIGADGSTRGKLGVRKALLKSRQRLELRCKGREKQRDGTPFTDESSTMTLSVDAHVRLTGSCYAQVRSDFCRHVQCYERWSSAGAGTAPAQRSDGVDVASPPSSSSPFFTWN